MCRLIMLKRDKTVRLTGRYARVQTVPDAPGTAVCSLESLATTAEGENRCIMYLKPG